MAAGQTEAANTTMSTRATPQTKHDARIEVALDIACSFMNSAPSGVGHAEMTTSLYLTCQEYVSAC